MQNFNPAAAVAAPLTAGTPAYENAAAHAADLDAWYEAWRWCSDDSRGPACWLSREARAALHDAGWQGLDPEGTAERLEEIARESVLSVLVRDGWRMPAEPAEPEEFELLLSTGGPALRLVGRLQDGEPRCCWLEVQDWGTAWTRFGGGLVDREALLWFAGLFWYGDQ